MAYNRFGLNESYINSSVKCVFISHQRKDKNIAKAIADYILKAGIDIYFDEYDASIDINNPYSVVSSIRNGISRSSHMLCLLSHNALESKWMPWEIGFGYDKTKVLGLTVKDIARSVLPEYLQIVPILRGTKSLNDFLANVCGKTPSQMLYEERCFSASMPNHPLDNYLNWEL